MSGCSGVVQSWFQFKRNTEREELHKCLHMHTHMYTFAVAHILGVGVTLLWLPVSTFLPTYLPGFPTTYLPTDRQTDRQRERLTERAHTQYLVILLPYVFTYLFACLPTYLPIRAYYKHTYTGTPRPHTHACMQMHSCIHSFTH